MVRKVWSWSGAKSNSTPCRREKISGNSRLFTAAHALLLNLFYRVTQQCRRRMQRRQHRCNAHKL